MKKIVVLLGFCFLSCGTYDIQCDKSSQDKVEAFMIDCAAHRTQSSCVWDLPAIWGCQPVHSMDGDSMTQVYFTPAESLDDAGGRR
jgi:hypothetical protein